MNTVTELENAGDLHRFANRGLMVHWINADILSRANCDIDKSIVFYDEHSVFEYAMPAGAELPASDILAALYDRTNIRYYTRGL